MKILWFTSTACSASSCFNPGTYNGTWMEALEFHLNKNPDIKLFISFYHHNEIKPFNYENSTYLPVKKKEKISSKICKRIFGQFKNEKINNDGLLQIIEKVNPDIIHVHGTETNFGLIQKYVSQPVVISMQGILSPICEKYFSGVQMTDVKKYKPLKYKFSPYSLLYRYNILKIAAKNELEILQMTKYIIGRTKWDKRITSILAPNANYYHLDELLRHDFSTHSWNNVHQEPNVLKIITVTGTPLYKGLETIIKTAQILKTYSKVRFTWDIVGLHDKDIVTRLLISLMKINLNELNISLHGKIPPEDFIPLMKSSNIFCQSSHIENSPNSLCEAMFLGMPIVATFAGGTESMLENYKEGILVQEGDPYSMAGAIMELKNNPDKAYKFAKNARTKAIKRHDPEKVVGDLLKIYKNIIQ